MMLPRTPLLLPSLPHSLTSALLHSHQAGLLLLLLLLAEQRAEEVRGVASAPSFADTDTGHDSLTHSLTHYILPHSLLRARHYHYHCMADHYGE